MGTNFYLYTADKESKNLFFGGDYELTEYPDLGFELHIAKTSIGWLPLFQQTDVIKSVKDIENIAVQDNISIIDEYGEFFTWDEFKDRVLAFNGGIKGIQKRELIDGEYVPISHFDYRAGSIANLYFRDDCGYEFSYTEFS